MAKIALAVHGGAGTIPAVDMRPELEREYRAGLEAALTAGFKILSKDGSALDAVEAAVCVLEDHPMYNAGRGSVLTHEGKVEMDAAIMDGRTLRAGSVAFVKNIRNPIKLARLVMERTEHVLLAGEGANQFAKDIGAALAPDEYFFSEYRWQQLQDAIAAGEVRLDHAADGSEPPASAGAFPADGSEPPASAGGFPAAAKPKGTVGAVACDINGSLAAATSTGGMTNKKFGRVGDTPIIGAGTYADNATCAVSCTGHGEFFMLGVTAYDLAARMKYKNLVLETAAQETIDHLTDIGGEGGFIAVDARGNIVLPFNSDGMYRGSITSTGEIQIDIYR